MLLLTALKMREDAVALDGTQGKIGPLLPANLKGGWLQHTVEAALHAFIVLNPSIQHISIFSLPLSLFCRGRITPRAPDPQIHVHTGTLPNLSTSVRCFMG